MGAGNKQLSWSLGRFLPVSSVPGALEGRVAALETYLVRLSEALEEEILLQHGRAEAEAQVQAQAQTQADEAEELKAEDMQAANLQGEEWDTHGDISNIRV